MMIMEDYILRLGRRLWAVCLLCAVSTATFAQDFSKLNLVQIASELNQPIAAINAGDGSHRLFILEQDGVIKIFDTNTDAIKPTPFLDISARIDSSANEQGLLGLAFHPEYASNGYFYVNYTRDPGEGQDLTVIARFSVSSLNPDFAVHDSEIKLMEIPQDARNHNGGDMHFGPDTYLYIGMGDGGGSNDEYKHAQDIDSLKGKMLRIDVDTAPDNQQQTCGLIGNYAIPDDNFFVDKDGCDEIWSTGLRNPWRFSFDRNTGDMLIGDVGQRLWEEINFEPANTAGVNYGWSCREGAHDFAGGEACVSAYIDPILEYSHSSGRCSITGGYVYRGKISGFNGYYFFGDYCSAQVWLAKMTDGTWVAEEWLAAAGLLARISSFGEDEQGELYITDRNDGKLFRILIEDDITFADGFENPP
jgi:glucose/arabinose dehydrogenase